MNTDFSDWAVRKTVKVYLSYHHAIHARAHAGLSWIKHALFAVLIHEGLKVKIVDRIPDQPDSGRLVIEDRLNVSIACVPKLDSEPDLWPAINSNSGMQTDWLLLNFGSSEPDFCPKPLDEAEQQERLWEKIIHSEEDELDHEESEAEHVP
jgi:hypothetical protein